MGRDRNTDDLYITVPSFFRCPISLDVMKSPVSLSTGVTYDRSSIQRWLDSGNNTCPATMQVLDNKDFIPNHTLHRLIQIWSTTSTSPGALPHTLSSHQLSDAISHVLDSTTPDNHKFESVVKILCFAYEKKENLKLVSSNEKLIDFLVKLVSSDGCKDTQNPNLVEVGLKLLHMLRHKVSLSMCKDDQHLKLFSALIRTVKKGSSDARVAAAGILEAVAPELEEHKQDVTCLLSEVLVLINSDSVSLDVELPALVNLLILLSAPRRNKVKLVHLGAVNTVSRLLANHKATNKGVELGLALLEALAGCGEGRREIVEDGSCITRLMHRLMKVSAAANEHAIAVLWSLCYLFRDQKAKDVVVRSSGGMTKILLLMQSNCSPIVKRMCCDLLRIFRVNSKSCLSSYDSKTYHITPC